MLWNGEYRHKEVGEWFPYLIFSYFKERLHSQYPGLDLCSVHKVERILSVNSPLWVP
jgi:hypothetical protein